MASLQMEGSSSIGGVCGLICCGIACVLQALSGNDPSNLRAQAAILRDRWAYFVRADAVEAAAAADGYGDQPAEVGTALENCRDVADELSTALRELAALVKRCSVDLDGNDEGLESEIEQLLQWTDHSAVPVSSTSCGEDAFANSGSAKLDMSALWRLSFAPYALSSSVLAVIGASEQKHIAERTKAMEATDLGLRLEDAADVVKAARAKLQATAALKGL